MNLQETRLVARLDEIVKPGEAKIIESNRGDIIIEKQIQVVFLQNF